MNQLFGQVVFTVGNEEYYWEDVVLAARLWGDWVGVEEAARQALACLEQAEESGESPSADEVQAASVEFRYEYDLISAQETEAWLERWGLTAESWMEYLKGVLLRKRWADELEEIAARVGVPEEDLGGFIHAEAVCSGSLGRFAQRLAGRAALHARMAESNPGASDPAGDGGDTETSGESEETVDLEGLSPERVRERLAVLKRLEASYRRFREQALTPKALKDQIGSHHLDWVRFDCQSVSFPDEQMAREAVLCLQEDCRDLADVAAESKRTLEKTRFFLDQMEPALRDRFLGARKGELLGPLGVQEGFVLYFVEDKLMPSENDPEIRQRAEEVVVESALEREAAARVEWQW